MADKKDKKELKGVVGTYNQQAVTKRKYYYNYGEVDNIEKGFNDSFSDLAAFNTKLKDELEKEKSVKLVVQKSDDEEEVNESCGGKKKKKKAKK